MALTTNKGQEKRLKDNELDTCCPFFVPETFEILKRRFYTIIFLLGGQSDILSTISSWGKEISNEEGMMLLDTWIDANIKEKKSELKFISLYGK